ncbi:MAG: hypothetical protein K1X86_00115 [Ignavibacteria bacterium]|nr:hypothetical protein [Ignavibacteria bacterium]
MKIILLIILSMGSYSIKAQSLTIWNESHDYDITEIKISYPYSQNTYNFIVSNNSSIDWNTDLKLQQPVYGRTAIKYEGIGGKGYYFINITWSNGFKIEKSFILNSDATINAGAANDGDEWRR